MQMIEGKTAELSGDLLDCLVATIEKPGEKVFFNADGYTLRWHNKPPAYSTDWAHGGPLIEKHQIDLCWDGADGKAMWWNAYHQDIADQQTHQSPLIAACRAIVVAKLGEVVRVPAELVSQ